LTGKDEGGAMPIRVRTENCRLNVARRANLRKPRALALGTWGQIASDLFSGEPQRGALSSARNGRDTKTGDSRCGQRAPLGLVCAVATLTQAFGLGFHRLPPSGHRNKDR
jgi:hypothetical protein